MATGHMGGKFGKSGHVDFLIHADKHTLIAILRTLTGRDKYQLSLMDPRNGIVL